MHSGEKVKGEMIQLTPLPVLQLMHVLLTRLAHVSISATKQSMSEFALSLPVDITPFFIRTTKIQSPHCAMFIVVLP